MANKSVGLLNIVFGADLRGFDRAMKKAQKNVKRFGTSMQKTGKTLTRNLTAPLAAFAAISIKNFDAQAKAETKLLVALKDRGDVQKRLIEQAKELQTKTLFGDEETIAAQAMLATMGLEEDAIKRLIPLVQDMAVAKGMDLVQAADLVAKSVGSSTNALSRYGIEITGAVGSSERLNSAVGSLTTMFEGQAQAAAEVGAGSLIQLKNILGDVSEDIGGIILPTIKELAEKIKELALKFNALSDEQKESIVKWVAIAAAVGPLLIVIGKLATGVSALIPIFVRLGAVMLANPIGLIITAIGALVGAFYWLITSTSDTTRTIRNAFKFMANGIITSLNIVIKGINKINPFKQIPLIKQFTYEAKKEFEEVGDSASDAAKEIEDLAKGLNKTGGAKTTTEGITPMPVLELAPPKVKLPDFKPYGDMTRNEWERLMNDMDAEYESTSKTIEEQTAHTVSTIVEDWQKGMDKVKTVLNSIGGFMSALNQKQSVEFDMWKEQQDEKAEMLDEQLEKDIERIENSSMSEERKRARIDELESAAAAKKETLDKNIEKREREMKRKQAVRDKAMGIVNAIISTAEAVMGAVAASPLTGGMPWSAIVAGLGAAQVATIASTPIPFAQGGLVSGPTLGLIGEGSGTSAFNPEVVSPLDKLMRMMGGNRVDVHGRIEGENIVLVSDKATLSRERFI